MFESQMPDSGDLPSSRQLTRATLGAAAVAAAILVTTVLPAEYGVDPTGVGGALGLTPRGAMKQAADAAPVAAPAVPVAATATMPETASSRTETVRLTLAPGAGTEVKATMRAGDEFDYAWTADGEVRFELHGEETGAAASDYTSYEKGTAARASGKFRAPFDGTHGWFWRNRTASPVIIEVRATGTYSKFAQAG